MAVSYGLGLSLADAALDTVDSTSTWVTSTSSTAGSTVSFNNLYNSMNWVDDVVKPAVKKPRKIVFMALNQQREHYEGDKFVDPIDELRVKVHKWLNPN